MTAFDEDSLGSFAGHDVLKDAPDPGISIEGGESIKLPLKSKDAKHILSVSEQAPYGKGTKTLVDIAVRDTRQIDASLIQITNKDWDTYLQKSIFPSVGEKLGVSIENFEAHLYKLLLYAEGGHFAAHQE